MPDSGPAPAAGRLPPAEYRIEDLAHRSGATVRTIRAYQDRGLLPRPERRGRANVYGDAHLARLRQISGLLDRGYTLASIKELLDAWDTGRGLGGVLGLAVEVDGPWTDEESGRITRAELDARFGGERNDRAVEEAVELGVLVRLPSSPDAFLVPSPQELAVAAELHAAGVPLTAISGHLRELRTQVEHIAGRFLDFTTEHVFHPYLGHPPTDEEAAQAAALVRRLRPLAQQTVDAELARAMHTLATRHLRDHLPQPPPAGSAEPPGEDAGDSLAEGAGDGLAEAPDEGRADGPAVDPGEGPAVDPAVDPGEGPADGSDDRPSDGCGNSPGPVPGAATDPSAATTEEVRLPAAVVRAVRELVGPENAGAFIAAAAEREVRARVMDGLLPPR
ncbi:MerR family transcriptional regulator [Streptomyces sp. SCA3-4]|uniref:MerR family transcriptional regulator n=1 Tax=Streptomyces sichuanensis TaxID=2871810 RepID=UPI001CE26CCD|nr:MerR family transcriptional regulator [Streptomyces sichuanensis]MCA6095361.1 MerR family transcriptional regulator [Streptomyces sichuanensis]